MKKGLENTDIVMVLRLQNERMDGNFSTLNKGILSFLRPIMTTTGAKPMPLLCTLANNRGVGMIP